MAHRQHFTFSLAPEVAHNHNFSLKDNRGTWPFKLYFLYLSRLFCFFSFLSFEPFLAANLTVSSSVVSFSLSPPLSLRLDQSITRWRLTLPCRKQQVLWISLSHTQMHTCPAGCINCSGVSVRLYIYLRGPTDWIKFCENWERDSKKENEIERERRRL